MSAQWSLCTLICLPPDGIKMVTSLWFDGGQSCPISRSEIKDLTQPSQSGRQIKGPTWKSTQTLHCWLKLFILTRKRSLENHVFAFTFPNEDKHCFRTAQSEYYTEAQKYIWQSYSSVNQHFVAYRWKLMSRGHTQKMYSLFGREKVFLLQK